jgi:hypothetical protein
VNLSRRQLPRLSGGVLLLRKQLLEGLSTGAIKG